MKKFNEVIKNLSQENNSSFYLGFFRVFICFWLLKKLIFQWKLIPLIYSGTDYLIPANKIIKASFISFNSGPIRDNIYLFLGIYVLFIIFLMVGIGKNLVALVVFLLYDILQKLCPQILNGGDNLMRFVLLYLVFADSFNFFSFGKYKRFLEIRNYFSNLSVLSLKIHLCIIYFISAIHKIHSDVWFNGVATYYTMNIERFNGTPYNLSLSKNSIFVTLSTYSTWFLELSYPFLVWFKASRKYIITLMIILHLSIAIFMMLYDFQILFIVVQGFFFVNEEFVANAKIRYSKIINLRLRLNKN